MVLGEIGFERLNSQLREELRPMLGMRVLEVRIEMMAKKVVEPIGHNYGHKRAVEGIAGWMEKQMGAMARESTGMTRFI